MAQVGQERRTKTVLSYNTQLIQNNVCDLCFDNTVILNNFLKFPESVELIPPPF